MGRDRPAGQGVAGPDPLLCLRRRDEALESHRYSRHRAVFVFSLSGK